VTCSTRRVKNGCRAPGSRVLVSFRRVRGQVEGERSSMDRQETDEIAGWPCGLARRGPSSRVPPRYSDGCGIGDIVRGVTRRLTLSTRAGMLAILVYLCLTLVSYAYYPKVFNPRDNWLSDLGNADLNSTGALFYRLGSGLTGVLLVVFFIGLWVIARGRSIRVKVFVLLSQVFGVIGAFALFMSGIFSLGAHASHSLWSVMLYIALGTAVFFCGWTFLYFPRLSRHLSYFAFAVTAVDWVMAAFNQTHFIEWIVVALMLIFAGAVSFRMIRVDSWQQIERPSVKTRDQTG